MTTKVSNDNDEAWNDNNDDDDDDNDDNNKKFIDDDNGEGVQLQAWITSHLLTSVIPCSKVLPYFTLSFAKCVGELSWLWANHLVGETTVIRHHCTKKI